MKKLIPLLLALTLLLSLGSAALADGEGQSHDYEPGDTATLDQKITTTIPEGKVLWHLEIPADVTITKGGYDEGRVDIGEVKIVVDERTPLKDDQQIEAYLQYSGEMFREDSADKYAYQLSVKTPDYDGTWEGYAALETAKDHNVGIKTKDDEKYDAPDAWIKTEDWGNMPQGSYAGTVIYSSKLVDKG